MGLRDETPGEAAPIPFDRRDPLERSRTTSVRWRSHAPRPRPAPGPTPRQQINTISSFIDASQVYGATKSRLDWLPQGTATTCCSPAATCRGHRPRRRVDRAADGPDGRAAGNPADAVVAGDVRANENIALTAIQTLFAREHNRIVGSLPAPLAPASRSSRSPGAWSAPRAVHHLQRVPAGARRPARAVPAATTRREPDARQRVRDRRLPGAQHGPRRVRADRAGGTAGAAARRRSGGRASRSSTNADGTHDARDPARRRVRQPGPVRAGRARRRCCRASASASTTTTSRSTTRCAACCSRCRSRASRIRAVCGEPVVEPELLHGVADLGADDIQRGRDHGIPTYNDLRAGVRAAAPPQSFTRHHRRVDRSARRRRQTLRRPGHPRLRRAARRRRQRRFRSAIPTNADASRRAAHRRWRRG